MQTDHQDSQDRASRASIKDLCGEIISLKRVVIDSLSRTGTQVEKGLKAVEKRLEAGEDGNRALHEVIATELADALETIRTLAVGGETGDPESVKNVLCALAESLERVLQRLGVKPFDAPPGKEYRPLQHKVLSPPVAGANRLVVYKQYERGYLWSDGSGVLRRAVVAVRGEREEGRE